MARHLALPRRRKAVVAALVAVPLALTCLGTSFAQAATDNSQTLPGSHPAWADAAHDRGEVAGSAGVDARIYLAGRDPNGLADYARSVADPQSAQYGHYLSPDQAQARFGASSEQIRAIRAWVKGAGLQVTGVTSEYVSVHGSASAVKQAFGTALHEYATTSGGTLRAPSGEVRVPASVAGAVLGVAGLAESNRVNHPASRATNAGTVFNSPSSVPYLSALPCSQYHGEKTATTLPAAYGGSVPWAVCGYIPQQVRGAYGVDHTGLTGKRVTVAIVDAYGLSTMQSDANTYATLHGDRAFRHNQYSEVVNPAQWTDQALCGGPAGWAGEEALDVESVHGMAPDANVVYVGANSCFDTTSGSNAQNGGLLDALTLIVDKRLADMVSNSWGEVIHGFDANGNPADMDPALIKAYEQTFQKGAVEGIGFYFSTGDCSEEDPATGCGANDGSNRPQTDYPTSDPWVTSVGGTSLGIGKQNNYLFETSWQDSTTGLTADRSAWASLPGQYLYGGGGGTSEDFAQPLYQIAAVPHTLATTLLNGTTAASPRRVVPDVSAYGDPSTGFLSGYTQPLPDGTTGYGEGRIGGTSLSCPTFVGLQADLQQALHIPLGFANPGIYLRALIPGQFRDVTDTPFGPGTTLAVVRNGEAHPALRTMAQGDRLHAVGGFDNATGLGSPDFSAFRRGR